MQIPPPVVVILAGGASRRMGRDKAGVEFAGHTSLARVRAAAAAAGLEAIVVGGGEPGALADLAAGQGPLQALLTAARAHPGRPLVAIACDMPLVTPALLARLAAPVAPQHAARVLLMDGAPQPLCACYMPAAAAGLEAAHARGERSLRRALTDLAVEWLDASALPAVDRLGAHDFDTPEDLAALTAALPPAPRERR